MDFPLVLSRQERVKGMFLIGGGAGAVVKRHQLHCCYELGKRIKGSSDGFVSLSTKYEFWPVHFCYDTIYAIFECEVGKSFVSP